MNKRKSIKSRCANTEIISNESDDSNLDSSCSHSCESESMEDIKKPKKSKKSIYDDDELSSSNNSVDLDEDELSPL
jgi:hypothetical protein